MHDTPEDVYNAQLEAIKKLCDVFRRWSLPPAPTAPQPTAPWDAGAKGLVLKGNKGPKNQRVKGTETLRVIRCTNIPKDLRKEIAHVRVVCEVRPQKTDPNRVRITVSGNRIFYPGDVGLWPNRNSRLTSIVRLSMARSSSSCKLPTTRPSSATQA